MKTIAIGADIADAVAVNRWSNDVIRNTDLTKG
jgi:hypothetical protein